MMTMRLLGAILLCFFVISAPVLAQQNTNRREIQQREAEQNRLSASPEAANQWNNYIENFLPSFFTEFPDYALGAGSHAYDSLLIVPDEEARKRQVAFIERALGDLKSYPSAQMGALQEFDRQILLKELSYLLFYLNEYQSWQWNPAEYNVCGSFSEILSNSQIPKQKRIEALLFRLKNVPAYYKAGANNLKAPTEVHTKLAIAQNTGGLRVFDDLLDSLTKFKVEPKRIELAKVDAKAAKEAVQKYIVSLQAFPRSDFRTFRLDPAIYTKKFEFNIQTGQSAKEVFQSATERKQFLHSKMFGLAKLLAHKYLSNKEVKAAGKDSLALINAVIDKISLGHCKPSNFQEKISAQLPDLFKFVESKNLLFQDPSKPLVVRKEPDYMAGVAGASISAPGPLEKGGNTYYNVGSLAAMSPTEQESFLREYNNYTLQILNIHEAIPGHYTQLVYANRSPSLVKSIFGNGAMIEGWAVFSELMMLENGYGDNSPELWLMYYKWNLRTVCNTILDFSIHMYGMEEPQALDLLQREAFQTEAEAKGKWKRATLSSVQLCSYFAGFDAILKLREEHKTLTVKAFNEKILSYGSAPLYLIRDAMKRGL